jgi:hypothetical protein
MRSFSSFALLLLACSDSVEPTPVDSGTDSGSRDGGRRDAAFRPDTGTPADSGTDSGMDAGTFDAGVDGGFPDPCTEGDCTTYFFVTTLLDIAQAAPSTPTIVSGFNLDGRVSDTTDAMGCFKEDYMSPPPDSETGVDNQLGPIVAGLGSGFDISGSIASAIAAGDLLILFEVEGVDDPMNDPEIGLSMYYGLLPAGVSMPMTGPDGRLTPGQTFDIDPRSYDAAGRRRIYVPGSIVGGRLRAGPVRIALDLGLVGGGIALDLRETYMRANLAGDGSTFSTGVLGASLDVDDTAEMLAVAIGFDVTIVRSVLASQSDLDPSPDGRMCASLSAGMVFEAVAAIKGAGEM